MLRAVALGMCVLAGAANAQTPPPMGLIMALTREDDGPRIRYQPVIHEHCLRMLDVFRRSRVEGAPFRIQFSAPTVTVLIEQLYCIAPDGSVTHGGPLSPS